MTREALWEFFRVNWGNLASVVGLFVSAATLLVARSARKAVDEAKTEFRRLSLADELQSAQAKTEQVGQFILQEKWEIVLLRAQDVVGTCSQILRRWGKDDLGKERRAEILRSREQLASIAEVAVRSNAKKPTSADIKRMAGSQQVALQLLSGQLAESKAQIDQGVRNE